MTLFNKAVETAFEAYDVIKRIYNQQVECDKLQKVMNNSEFHEMYYEQISEALEEHSYVENLWYCLSTNVCKKMMKMTNREFMNCVYGRNLQGLQYETSASKLNGMIWTLAEMEHSKCLDEIDDIISKYKKQYLKESRFERRKMI